MPYSQRPYIKNSEIMEVYNVSATSVLNWIEGAVVKKNDMEVFKVGKKHKVSDTPHNRAVLRKLSDKASIYRNKSQKATTTVSLNFYENFTSQSLVEIINSLELRQTLPFKYTTFGDGGKKWLNCIKLLEEQTTGYQFSDNVFLAKKAGALSLDLINAKTKFQKLTLFVIYPRSSKVIQTLLDSLGSLKEKVKTVYLVDPSEYINKEIQHSLQTQLPDLKIETSNLDLEKEGFELLAFQNSGVDSLNLVYFGFNTLNLTHNPQIVLENVKKSLRSSDLLLLSQEIDGFDNRSDFDYLRHQNPLLWILEMFGMDIVNAEILNRYDAQKLQKNTYIVSNKDYTIQVKNQDLDYIFKINKDAKIRLLNQKLPTKIQVLGLLEQSGFEILEMTVSKSKFNLLTVCKLQDIAEVF